MSQGIKMHDVILKESGYTGDSVHRYFYEQEYPGQANYLDHRCKESGIRAVVVGRRVMLYAKTKIPEFLALIEESKTYVCREEPCMECESMAIVHDQTLLGVLVKGVQRVFVTQSHFSELLYRIYKREIPHFNTYSIFNTKKEMVDVLMNQYNIVV